MNTRKHLSEMTSFLYKCFIASSFLFPLAYSKFGTSYFLECYLPYVFLFLFTIFGFILKARDRAQFPPFFWFLSSALLVMNILFLYYNVKHLHLYWEQINITLVFLPILLLLLYPSLWTENRKEWLPFTIKCILISCTAGIVYKLMGYSYLKLYNNKIKHKAYDAEFRLSWIYMHKSELALILLLFLILFLVSQTAFRSRLSFYISLSVLLITLVFTHSWTGIIAGVGMLAAYLLSLLLQKKVHIKPIWYVSLLPVAGIGLFVMRKLLQERNLSTLGSRIPIWKASLQAIIENPTGIGTAFNRGFMIDAQLEEGIFSVNNCHNTFMNELLRFSVPVGICISVLILSFMLYCFLCQRTFFAACALLALLMLLNIDYALMRDGLGAFLFLLYIAFVNKEESRKCNPRSN